MKGKIAEIFHTVQGEGIYLGERQIFLRFFGCNLNCRFCDTKLNSFNEYEPEEVVKEIESFEDEFHSVVFTGGEPLLQRAFLKEILPLIKEQGRTIYLETNGTLPHALNEVIDYVDIIAMDFKLPSSTGLSHFWNLHQQFLEIASSKEVFVKTVICHSTNEEDFIRGVEIIKKTSPISILILHPNSYEDSFQLRLKMARLKRKSKEKGIFACTLPRIHKAWGFK
ncbi:MAG: 7-carboxy-7-deazaguanine synthase QueE [Candidatus Omnitrophica bacterium]|nr:7-carboxy-7-deazaguanine synthase QueE [Candidatus Omnitrophota bacterium]